MDAERIQGASGVVIMADFPGLDDDVLRMALDKWGPHVQMDMLIEEMAELTQALLHARRKQGQEPNPYLTKEVIEELADVIICCRQLELLIIGNDTTKTHSNMVCIQIDEKVKRLYHRIMPNRERR